ncbi:Peroxisomal acyl-coenzyme A oxidase 1 [Cyphellophora attinorum]|uniref:Acyl-coenzyme A oxidase n=1 Tax=Cyphellophora attinorum TaxID=1664694 RepID=A0A0N0NMA0_9EURO|nr:Peroxisomal acyl-coenzyme A oxidase 1 [Phialophora attinorum]KPI39969.1 Peroxisomal acyl-coenzyme A oxidase 1 [Phialophora attinorum]
MSDFTHELQPAEPSGPSVLQKERDGSSINVDQLATHLLSRNDFLNRQKRILAIIKDIPYFCKRNQLNMARPDRYHLGLARAKTLKRLSIQHKWDDEDYKMADYLMDEMGPYALQFTMFATSIREQCNEEQKKHWLPKLDSWEIIGCYGQTELGHGSNVKGIECEARWDPRSKQFTIHSPTLTASKWWNGALGRTANHAIVVAQLLLPDAKTGQYKSHGPHQFMVQIRDMKTHRPLEGIVIGDIGPKYGYTAMDNGYMLFNNYKVPHSALLSRYSGVDSEHGTYIKPENAAVVYGSLTFVRAQIVMHARLVLARAVTIATRYLSIRRQFADRDSKDPNAAEVAVLNYPTVQIRILPLLATTFALHYTGEAMYKLYYGTRQEIEQSGDFTRLAEMHAASSGLKSLSTMLAADGIETCRRAMGGHGFGGGSGMIPLNNDYLSKPTVEGDNWMITQQTASYLIKRMTQVIGKPNEATREPVDAQFRNYIKSSQTAASGAIDILSTDEALVLAFQHRLSYLSHQVYKQRIEQKKPWTELMISLHNLSRAHSQQLLVSNFHDAVFKATPDPPLDSTTLSALQDCFRLFSLYTLDTCASEFLLSGAISTSTLQAVQPRIQALMKQIRPHAVRLVDAWSIPDYLLESSLGRYDGDVYNDLFRKAHLENPLNLQTFNPDWKTEEIIMGEGADVARRRLETLALGVTGHEQRGGRAKL